MLIVSITLFGNCSWTMQAALAVTYALLNVMYWVSAILPERYSWRFDRILITKEEPIKSDSFTAALWVAINKSRDTSWVTTSRAIPDTPVWIEWLEEAKDHMDQPPDGWDARRAYSEIQNAAIAKRAAEEFKVVHGDI